MLEPIYLYQYLWSVQSNWLDNIYFKLLRLKEQKLNWNIAEKLILSWYSFCVHDLMLKMSSIWYSAGYAVNVLEVVPFVVGCWLVDSKQKKS